MLDRVNRTQRFVNCLSEWHCSSRHQQQEFLWILFSLLLTADILLLRNSSSSRLFRQRNWHDNLSLSSSIYFTKVPLVEAFIISLRYSIKGISRTSRNRQSLSEKFGGMGIRWHPRNCLELSQIGYSHARTVRSGELCQHSCRTSIMGIDIWETCLVPSKYRWYPDQWEIWKWSADQAMVSTKLFPLSFISSDYQPITRWKDLPHWFPEQNTRSTFDGVSLYQRLCDLFESDSPACLLHCWMT
jgi:hypothetical protein